MAVRVHVLARAISLSLLQQSSPDHNICLSAGCNKIKNRSIHVGYTKRPQVTCHCFTLHRREFHSLASHFHSLLTTLQTNLFILTTGTTLTFSLMQLALHKMSNGTTLGIHLHRFFFFFSFHFFKRDISLHLEFDES